MADKEPELLTKIERPLQPYVDEPIVHNFMPRPDLVSALAHGIASAFGGEVPQQISEITGYNRVRLNWKRAVLKPDGEIAVVDDDRRPTKR